MSEAIGVIHNAMRADAEALRIVAQNIANAEVTAYRRQIPLQTVQFASALSAESAASDAVAASQNQSRSVAIDAQPGTLQSTGEPLHVALEGAGFFVLQSPAGNVLTRRGDFRVSAEGVLSAASGEAVLGENGPIQVGIGTAAIEVDGTIRIGGDVIDRLRVAQADAAQLQYLGGGLYASSAAVAESESYPVVRQGFLETSNVTPVNEMVQLMETLRHFEAAQRFVHGYDQMLEKAISELGKVG